MNKLFSTETSLRLTFLSLSWFFLLSFFFFLFYSGSIKSFSLINTILLFSIIIYNFIYFIILFYEKNFIYLLFTPLFWYKIVSIIFYGFGPLAYYFGNNFTLTFMHSYYFTSQQTLYKIIIIYLIIILTVDLLIIIYNSIFKLNFKNQVQKFDKKLFLYYVLALGFFIKYLIVIPLTISGVGYPGVFNQFTRFILIGLFIAYTLGIKDKFYRKMFYAILFFELLSSFITLSKEPILITIIFATFTVIYYNNNFKRLIINAVFLISIYALIQPIFSVLRSTDSNEFGITSFSELSKAYNTVQFFYSDDFTQSLFRNYQGWWTRVSYVNYQAYAVEAYGKI